MLEVDEASPLLRNGDNSTTSVGSSETLSPSHKPHAPEHDLISTATLWTVVPFLLLGVLIANADMTIVIASSQRIASEFGVLSDASWLVTSYILSECASQPMYGKASDIFGRRAALIFAYLLFATGCFLCGIGKQFGLILAGRAISGAGGAGMTALVSIIVTDMVPVRQVAQWRSYINIAQTLGRSLGGPVGGLLADTIGWRWSFFGQCPLTAVATILVLWKVPASSHKAKDSKDMNRQKWAQKLKRIDVLGSITLAVTIVAVLLVLELAKEELSWKLVIIPLVTCIVSALAFYITEARVKEPVLPLALLSNRAVMTSYAIVGLQNAAQVPILYLTTLYFQIAMGKSVADAGLRTVPAVVGNATGGLMSGYLISKTGRYKFITMAATISAGIGYLLITLRWRGDTSWPESLYIFFGGFGMGIIVSTTFVHLTASLQTAGFPSDQVGMAGANSYLAQNIACTIGLQVSITTLHAVLRSVLQTELEQFDNRSEYIEMAVKSVSSISHLPEAIRTIVVSAYVRSLTWSFALSLVTALLALPVELTIQEQKT